MLRLAALGLGLTQLRSVGQPKPGAAVGLPAVHGDHAVVHAQAQRGDEPVAEFAHGHAVAHGHGAGADEALPAFAQREAFDRAARRVGPVQHPHRLAVLCGGFQHVAQRGDEGVDAAAEVLQVDQQHVEAVHHRVGRAAHLAVQAEHRDAQCAGRGSRATRPCCPACRRAGRAAGRRRRDSVDVGQRGQRVERVREVARDRGGVGQQGHALAFDRGAKRRVLQETIEAELHGVQFWGKARRRTRPAGWWKSGRSHGCCKAQ